MVNAATAAAVKASISTPVRSAVFTSETMRTPVSSSVRSTLMPVSASGWQRGINSEVFLAAMIPATRATPSTAVSSPFLRPPPRTTATVSGFIATKAVAVASRTVALFSETSTIVALPSASTWESLASGSDMGGKGLDLRQVIPELRPQLGVLERQRGGCLQVALLGARVPPATAVAVGHQAALARQHRKGVRQLDL